MNNALRPPVPQSLREKLKDYPELIERLQAALDHVVDKPSPVTPPFEHAIWTLEDALDAFMSEARTGLATAEASGHAKHIADAKAKKCVIDYASERGEWRVDESLWEYFQADKGAFR